LNSSANQPDLWAKASGGDHNAYALLHASLYPGLYQYLFKIVKDEDIAADLLQELFVKLWQKRNRVGVLRNVKAYFFTAARSMAINYFRQVKSQSIRIENYTPVEMDFSAEDIIISAENDTNLKSVMTNALNTLPARQREIIYLKYYEEMDYQKIAEVTGIQYQSVINHVFRALQTLRTAFANKYTERELIF
jgi:RNA polymerase sigma factor (sigma-70 family)